jgi:hypothetical protein
MLFPFSFIKISKELIIFSFNLLKELEWHSKDLKHKI